MKIPFKQTPNYAKGTGVKKTAVVWHGTLGEYKGAVNWLCMTKAQRGTDSESSAHYVIGRNEGEIIQLVKNEDIAWHAGIVNNPSERFKKVALYKNGKYVNPNQWTIGIEFAWGYDMNNDKKVDANEKRINEWQFKAVKELMDTFGFPITKDIVLTHSEIADYKTDNLMLDIEEYFRRQEPKVVPVVQKEEICMDKSMVDDLRSKVQKKEVLGLFGAIKKLFKL